MSLAFSGSAAVRISVALIKEIPLASILEFAGSQ